MSKNNSPTSNRTGDAHARKPAALIVVAIGCLLALVVGVWAFAYDTVIEERNTPNVEPNQRAASGSGDLVFGFVFIKDDFPDLLGSVTTEDKSLPVCIRLELDVAGTDLQSTHHYCHIHWANGYIAESNGVVAMGKGVHRTLRFTGVGGSPDGGVEIELVLAEDRETIDWAMDFHNEWQPWISSMVPPSRPLYSDGTVKPPFLADGIAFGDRNLTRHEPDEGPYIRFQRGNFMAKVSWFGNSSAASAVMPIAEQILTMIDSGEFSDASGFAASSPPEVSIALDSYYLATGDWPGYAAAAQATPVNLVPSVVYTFAMPYPLYGVRLDNFTMPTVVKPGSSGPNQIHIYAVHDNLRYTFSAVTVNMP